MAGKSQSSPLLSITISHMSKGNISLIIIALGAVAVLGAGFLLIGGKERDDTPAMMEKGVPDTSMAAEGMMAGDNQNMVDTSSDMTTDAGAAPETDKRMDTDMENTMAPKDTMSASGSYEAYAPEKLARAEQGNVVLFFHASWCPYCRAADEDISKNLSAIPKNLSILKVDYDSATALRQKYGVTTQHTFVAVDAKGNLIRTWQGSPTLADIVAHVQ